MKLRNLMLTLHGSIGILIGLLIVIGLTGSSIGLRFRISRRVCHAV